MGSAQPVSLSVDLPDEAEAFAPRQTRLLPLSGKTDEALRDLTGRYLSWINELSSEDEDLLADMAWTAGVGRTHFDHRTGIVFQDIASLREKLQTLIETGERQEPRTATKIAFAYTGQDSQWIGMGKDLYESEPVVRSVLDRCDKVLREERDTSLLDAMFGQTGDLSDLTQPAIYAMESALTALWSSMGIQPSVVVGRDIGEIAAAQAAGVFSLEDGLRVALERDTGNLEATLTDVTIASPSLVLVSSVTGGVEVLDAAYWRRQAQEQVAFDKCAKKLTDLGVDIIIEIGPDAMSGSIAGGANPPRCAIESGKRRFCTSSSEGV